LSDQESRKTGRLRLRHLREHTEAVEERMDEQRGRFQRLATNDAKIPVFSSFNLFPTPPDIADQLIAMADLHVGQKILEPSAGTGNLLRAIRKKFDKLYCDPPLDFCKDGWTWHHMVEVTAVEIDGPLWNHLSDSEFAMFTNARLADFLTWEAPHKFDRIVMNPPFKNGVDRKHILRAKEMLAPGGRLVSLCANGPRQRQTLMPIADQWIELPAGSFKEEATNVNVAICVFNN